ncbi:MAG: hypothetical protein GF421_09800 [Candidatus Aminicenantes bacterium]|nr:hypothetical protein [Candidatus Aminicenantes bacterium]
MKKLFIIIPLIIVFLSGCIVIEERYRAPGPRVRTVDYYDYSPAYYGYYDYYWYPSYYWMGMSWWNPFWYYGFYNYYYGWYYPYYSSYYYYPGSTYPSRYTRGKSVVTKDGLKNPRKTGVSTRRIRSVDRKAVSRSKTRPTRVRSIRKGSRIRSSGSSRVSRVRSSGTRTVRSTRSSATRSRSSGSSSRTKKKK